MIEIHNIAAGALIVLIDNYHPLGKLSDELLRISGTSTVCLVEVRDGE